MQERYSFRLRCGELIEHVISGSRAELLVAHETFKSLDAGSKGGAVLDLSSARSAGHELVMHSEDLWDIGDLVGAGDDGIRCTDLQVAGLGREI